MLVLTAEPRLMEGTRDLSLHQRTTSNFCWPTVCCLSHRYSLSLLFLLHTPTHIQDITEVYERCRRGINRVRIVSNLCVSRNVRRTKTKPNEGNAAFARPRSVSRRHSQSIRPMSRCCRQPRSVHKTTNTHSNNASHAPSLFQQEEILQNENHGL